MKELKKQLLLIVILAGSLLFQQCANNQNPDGWKKELGSTLELAGHRNWIVIADAAYPLQSAPGIRTIATGTDHLEVLQIVLDQINFASHVNAIILTDEELKFVPESEVPGIDDYRKNLEEILNGKEVSSLEHIKTISKLDEASKLFNILVLKTTMNMPYTSIFIELDCGYWGPEQEKRMRCMMQVRPGIQE